MHLQVEYFDRFKQIMKPFYKMKRVIKDLKQTYYYEDSFYVGPNYYIDDSGS